MTTHFDELYEPIKQMNEKLTEAAKIARTKPGLKLAGQMIDYMRVIAIGPDFLILRPTKSFMYSDMFRHNTDILKAIKLAVPEVKKIRIIKVTE